jgi:N-acetylglucosamine repressor
VKISQTKDIRASNRLTILNHIISNQPVSRAEVSSKTGLNKATVSTIVKEWIDMDLVTETELGDSTGGRKPILLQQIADAAYCIAIEISVTKIRVILCNLANQLIQHEVLPIEEKGFTVNYCHLSSLLEKMIAQVPSSPYGIIGIGVSIWGVVDLDGVIRNIPQLQWRNIDLKKLLEDRFGIPVYVNNDGNLAAMCEMKRHPEYADMVTLNIGDTISAGLVANGQVIHGFLGFANALAHHTINFTEKTPCSCGKYGCWEQYCSNQVVIQKMNEHLDQPIHTIEEFIQLVREENPDAKEILEDFIQVLGVGIANAIFILNSEVIILNSKIISAFPYLLPEIENHILLPITQTQEFLISDLGDYSSILGAADQAIQRFYGELANR